MKVKSKIMAALGSIRDQAAIGHNILSAIQIAILRSTDSSSRPTLDDKHVHEILFEISNAPGTITFLARRISARLSSTRDRVVALKTLLLLHRLLRGGDRYFEQDLRNLWSSGELQINLSWMVGDPDPMCSFVLSYSLFLGERMEWIINQAGKLEPNRPSSVSLLLQQSYEEKKAESILYGLSKCQILLDRIVECSPSVNNLTSSNTVIQSVMSIILRESFRVYESFCEGVEIVLSSFLDLKKPMRVLAIDIFRKACIQTSNLHSYYDKCKKFVAGKSLDYPLVRIFTTAEVAWMELDSSRLDETTGKDIGAVESYQVSLSTLFNQGLETKISTVWVEFDEEDSQSSSFSFEGIEDCIGSGDRVTEGETSVQGKAMELL